MNFIFGINELEDVAEKFLPLTDLYSVFSFDGNLGAGKTTFIKALCGKMGVKDLVSSPTFSIINEYRIPDAKVIYHIDLYRLRNEVEAINAGVEECIYSDNISFVEWPGRAPGLFPEKTVKIFLEINSNDQRHMNIELPV